MKTIKKGSPYDEWTTEKAQEIVKLLKPALKIMPNGHYPTDWGNKSDEGLIESIKTILNNLEEKRSSR